MSEELDLSLVKKWTLEEMVEPESAEGSPKKSKKLKAIQWGFPGHLTQQELGVYVSKSSCRFQEESLITSLLCAIKCFNASIRQYDNAEK